jgi:adenine phosphoribosyltransferase
MAGESKRSPGADERLSPGESEAVSRVSLRSHIRDIRDFPQPGIVFRDITPLLLHPPAFDEAVQRLAGWARPREVDIVVAAEARGFVLGGALARELGAGFVPARKPGKLPADTVSVEYLLEYGVDALHVHADALAHGARVLVHDDLLATGGTARAVCDLVRQLGAEVVGCAFLVELAFMGGRERLAEFDVHALVSYEEQ